MGVICRKIYFRIKLWWWRFDFILTLSRLMFAIASIQSKRMCGVCARENIKPQQWNSAQFRLGAPKIEMWIVWTHKWESSKQHMLALKNMCVCINMDYMAKPQPSEGSRQNIHNYVCVSLSLSCEYRGINTHTVSRNRTDTLASRAYDWQKQTQSHARYFVTQFKYMCDTTSQL